MPSDLVNASNMELQLLTGTSSNKLKAEYPRIEELMKDIADIWEDLDERELPPEDYRYTRQLMRLIDSIVDEVAALMLKQENISTCST